MKRTKLIHGIAATLLSFFFLWAGARAADIYHLPLIHGWALAHGAIFIVFPVYFVAAYLMLIPLVRGMQPAEAHTAESPRQQLSMLAVASLLISGAGFFLPFVGSGLGVVTGHVARRRCRNNPELSGAGFALFALILGYVGLFMWAYSFGMVSWVVSHHGS